MDTMSVFISVGTPANERQEAFIRAVEDRLRSEGLVPHTVGRNTFSSDAPLKAVTELMDKCSGAVVIALERSFFPKGLQKRGGPEESAIANVKLPTPWNQVEAAMAYARGHPLLIVVENGLKSEGLLERGYDWYVQFVIPDPSALHSLEFNGVLASWKEKVQARKMRAGIARRDPAEMTVGEILKSLRPSQVWAVLAAVLTLLIGAFTLGANLFAA
jgi:hypothetical protein